MPSSPERKQTVANTALADIRLNQLNTMLLRIAHELGSSDPSLPNSNGEDLDSRTKSLIELRHRIHESQSRLKNLRDQTVIAANLKPFGSLLLMMALFFTPLVEHLKPDLVKLRMIFLIFSAFSGAVAVFLIASSKDRMTSVQSEIARSLALDEKEDYIRVLDSLTTVRKDFRESDPEYGPL